MWEIIGLGLFAIFSAGWAFIGSRINGENKIKKENLEETIKENEQDRKNNQDFNNLDNAAKSNWLFKRLEKRAAKSNKNS